MSAAAPATSPPIPKAKKKKPKAPPAVPYSAAAAAVPTTSPPSPKAKSKKPKATVAATIPSSAAPKAGTSNSPPSKAKFKSKKSSPPTPSSPAPAPPPTTSPPSPPPSSPSSSTPTKKPHPLQKLLQGWWLTPDGRAATWRTDTTSPKNNVKGWVRNPGTKNPLKVGLALDVKAKKKDVADEVLEDMPGRNDVWYVPKGKVPVAWWDGERTK